MNVEDFTISREEKNNVTLIYFNRGGTLYIQQIPDTVAKNTSLISHKNIDSDIGSTFYVILVSLN